MIVFIAKGKPDTDLFIRKGIPLYCDIIGIPSFDFEIIREEGGKPMLKPAALEISVTHSGDYVLLTVSPFPVGIDLEQHREKVDFSAILKRFFHQKEEKSIFDEKSFFDLWTRKEAVAKKRGCGLSPSFLREDFTDEEVKNYDLFDGYSLAIAGRDVSVAFMPIFLE